MEQELRKFYKQSKKPKQCQAAMHFDDKQSTVYVQRHVFGTKLTYTIYYVGTFGLIK